MIGLLQPERELVDLVWISDHQLVQIIAVRREFLSLIRIRRDAPQWCRRAFQPKPARADHRKAAQSVTELGGNAAANDPPPTRSRQGAIRPRGAGSGRCPRRR